MASLIVGLMVAAACAIPGRLYRVAPAVSGSLRGQEGQAVHEEGATLILRVLHRNSPVLHATQERALGADGRFDFDPVELAVAGHEYTKSYRLLLHLRSERSDRVLWRAELSRLALAGPIELDCLAGRAGTPGQPCQVRNPLEQPWLVAGGKRTYLRLCARCHGADGSGATPVAEGATSSTPRPADLRTIAARNGGRFDRAEIEEWIEGRSRSAVHGPREMPVWGERLRVEYERYSDGEEMVGATLDPVLVYLESLQIAEP